LLYVEPAVEGANEADGPLSSLEPVEEGLGGAEVLGVEALGEPPVDIGERAPRVLAPALVAPQAGEARRRAQLQRPELAPTF